MRLTGSAVIKVFGLVVNASGSRLYSGQNRVSCTALRRPTLSPDRTQGGLRAHFSGAWQWGEWEKRE
jgi:hypothetical protein